MLTLSPSSCCNVNNLLNWPPFSPVFHTFVISKSALFYQVFPQGLGFRRILQRFPSCFPGKSWVSLASTGFVLDMFVVFLSKMMLYSFANPHGNKFLYTEPACGKTHSFFASKDAIMPTWKMWWSSICVFMTQVLSENAPVRFKHTAWSASLNAGWHKVSQDWNLTSFK